jgi:putative transposase
LKTNAKYQIIRTKAVKKNTGVIADEIIEFTGVNTHKKYPHPLRKVTYVDTETNKELVFLTNELKLAAATIAAIYKARWEIELFFKTIKQNLKIKRFMGTSRNAVLTQIWIAMIAYLLVSFYKFSQKTAYSIQQLFRLINVNLLERKSLIHLVKSRDQITITKNLNNQLALFKT